MFSDLVGAEVTLEAGRSLSIEVDPAHEHGLLCDTGLLTVGEVTAKPGELAFHATGTERITVEAGPDEPARFLVLGGAPFGEQIVMWWNFIGRSHDEVVGFREDWQRERVPARRGRMPPRSPARATAPSPRPGSTPSRRPACPTSGSARAADRRVWGRAPVGRRMGACARRRSMPPVTSA